VAERTYVVGVGMTKFEKPGARSWDYPDMAREAGQAALQDARCSYGDVDAAFVGYCYGDSTSGQRAVYELGLSGLPVINVNNNCATGATALHMARNAVASGVSSCALALGFEKMQRGAIGFAYEDRALPLDRHLAILRDGYGQSSAPLSAQFFGNAGREYMERYGVSRETTAQIAVKNHRHSTNNPLSQYQVEYSLDDILSSPMVHEPLTRLQCCPTSDGGAAALVASEGFVRDHQLHDRAVEIVGQALVTDDDQSFDGSSVNLVGFQMTRRAATSAFAQAGLRPTDVQVIELHDCFSTNELITYEGLGLCAEGRAGALVEAGDVSYGGRWVVNPSGGLMSKGHPLGATGLAQCAELAWQLRGEAGKRQVDQAVVGLQHNLGLGGAAVVTIYRGPGASS
jgi:acetyl-CoA acetyltransferase